MKMHACDVIYCSAFANLHFDPKGKLNDMKVSTKKSETFFSFENEVKQVQTSF